MVESGGLENRCGRKLTESSNLSLSAIFLIANASRPRQTRDFGRTAFKNRALKLEKMFESVAFLK